MPRIPPTPSEIDARAHRELAPRVSVVIPTLDEERNLIEVLPRIPQDVDEVVIVDGRSADETVKTARAILPSVRIVMQVGSGKGSALREGFASATGDIIVMLDADGSTDPGEIPAFVGALMAGADFAKGSRFLQGGGTADMTLHRKVGNGLFVKLVRMLFGGRYTDLCYGYNAFWADVLPALSLDGDGFEIETMMNIRALRAGLKITEVPSFEGRRVHGIGHLRAIPDGLRVLRTILSEVGRKLPVQPAPQPASQPARGRRSWGDSVLPLRNRVEMTRDGDLVSHSVRSDPVAVAIEMHTPGRSAGDRIDRHTVAVIGTGYVGLATAVMLSELGHRVVGIDLSRTRVEMLARGESPIFEPGLAPLLESGLRSGRLTFTDDYAVGLRQADFAFLCVATPSLPGGKADTSQVRAAAGSIAAGMAPGSSLVVVNKSTMPVGSAEMVEEIVFRRLGAESRVEVVVNPEFLREGHAIEDVFHPYRVVIGAERPDSASQLASLFRPLGAPMLLTDRRSAEMVKYAANAFLATKISFINEIAHLCENLEVDVTAVSEGLALDPRIGPDHLRAGIGFGGSCLPKDLDALRQMGETSGVTMGLLHAAADTNQRARQRFVARLERLSGGLEGRVVGVLGLAFKEGTADLRASPALDVIHDLRARGATVRAYDPMSARMSGLGDIGVQITSDPYEAASAANALCVLTAWPEFLGLDFGRIANLMHGDLVFDGRNVLDAEAVRAAGLRYSAVGRPAGGERTYVVSGTRGAETAQEGSTSDLGGIAGSAQRRVKRDQGIPESSAAL